MAVNIAHCLERVLDGNPADIDISGGWIRDIHRQLAGEFFPNWADWRFQWIHPFKDFNGRVGRILLVALCYKLNLPPANPAADDASRTQYFDALRQADRGDFAALNEVWMERLGA